MNIEQNDSHRRQCCEIRKRDDRLGQIGELFPKRRLVHSGPCQCCNQTRVADQILHDRIPGA